MIAELKTELEDLISAEMDAVATSKHHKKNMADYKNVIFKFNHEDIFMG